MASAYVFAGLLALLAIAALIVFLRRRAARARAGAAGEEGEGAWVSRTLQGQPPTVKIAKGPGDAEAQRADARGGSGLQGNLAQTPLHDLLQYLALGRKSGILELASGRRTGRIVLAEGKIGKAAYRGKEGLEAAFQLMDLSEGDFEFYDMDEAHAERFAQPIEIVDAIMLWMARKPRKKPA